MNEVKKLLSFIIISFAMGAIAAPVTETISEENKSKLVFLEYIEGKNVATIETKYVPAKERTSVRFKGAFVTDSAYSQLFATSTGEKENALRVIKQNTGSLGLYATCCWRQNDSKGHPLSRLEQVFEGYMSRNSVTIDSNTYDTSTKAEGTANTKVVTLLSSINPSTVRLYYVEFLDNGVPAYRFLPCAYNNVVGVYDEVNSVFYKKSAGGGTFSGHNFTVETEAPSYPMADGGVTPKVIVRDVFTGEIIEQEGNYTVTYKNNTQRGTATATVTHISTSTKCFGTRSVNFYISKTYKVSPDATSNGDGSSWDNPITLTSAISDALEGDTLFLKSGKYTLSSQLVLSKAVSILGGYAGTDNETLDAENPISVLTTDATIDTLVNVTASSGTLSMERIQIEKAAQYGMQKSNAACNLYVSGCNFVSNGYGATTLTTLSLTSHDPGKGLRILGSIDSDILVTNCVFAYNCQTSRTTGAVGAALYVATSKSAYVVDSKFFANSACLGPDEGSPTKDLTDFLYHSRAPGSAIYTTSRIHVRNCDFRANVGNIRRTSDTYSTAGGVIWFESGSDGSSVSNCTFIGNLDRVTFGGKNSYMGGPIVLKLGSTTQLVNIYGSTFAYNFTDAADASAGVTAHKGTANIKNCVFGGNHIYPGATTAKCPSDIKVGDEGVVNISYSVLGYEKERSVYSTASGVYNEGLGVIYSDPMFVSRPEDVTNMITRSTIKYNWNSGDSLTYLYSFPNTPETYEKIASIDVHLLSTAGYVVNGEEDNFLISDKRSPAIDAADPLDDYSLELEPNGSRRNAGVYGNTPQASKTKTSTIPLGFENIVIDYPSGYSKPRISFTVTGDEGVSLDVSLSGSVNGENPFNAVLTGCIPGKTYEFFLPDFYAQGSEVEFVLSGTSASGTVNPINQNFSVEANLPEWWGHGGGESVLHVWSEAIGDGTGRDWHNACRTWDDLVAAYAARDVKPEEVWFIDIAKPSKDADVLTVTSPLVLRGGFTYLCNHIEDRAEGVISSLSAQRAFSLANIKNDSAKVTIERLEFTRSTKQGLVKTGAGNLEIRDCKFYMNSYNVNAVNGRGLYVTGAASSTYVSVSNCVFAANGMFTAGGYSGGSGCGAFFQNIARVTLDSCHFVTNGVMRSGDYPSANYGGDSTFGSAVYLNNAPLTARNCSFIANQGVNRRGSNGDNNCGGAIRFVGNCNGSVMTNCIVSGCSDRCGWSGTGDRGYHGGAILVAMGDKDYTLDLVNVTIAYNLSDGVSCPGGINIYAGTVNLKNSIVFGNFSSRNTQTGNRFGGDIDVKATGVLNAEYTLFTEDSTNSVSYAEGATITLGEGVIFGDPLFVTSFDTAKSKVTNPFGSNFTYFNTTAANVGKLTEFNLHLRGGRGYYDEKTGALVTDYKSKNVLSPAMDAGNKSSSYAQERDRGEGWHGRRVNLGAYGNTPWATMTTFPGSVIRIR